MKKGKLGTIELYVPRATFYVVKTVDIRKFTEECFIKEYPTFRIPSLAVNAVVYQDYSEYGPIHWMIFKRNPANSTIAHESLHVVDYLCDAYGINDGEFRAYLIGYLVEQIEKL